VTLADRVSVLVCIVIVLLGLFAPQIRQALDAIAARRADARQARRLKEIARATEDLMPILPFGCGCCGRDCPDDKIWCAECELHVGTEGTPVDRTYFALHGIDCPYAVEETRLMPNQGDPGDENDQAPEGLGIVRPPRCHRAHPSRTTPLELLPKPERDLWREALKASL